MTTSQKNVPTAIVVVLGLLVGLGAFYGATRVFPDRFNKDAREHAEHSEHEHAEHSDEHEHEEHEHAEHLDEHVHAEHSDEHVHAEHEHVHNPDEMATTDQALANIGIEKGPAGTIELTPTTFAKTISFPGVVRYKPGRSLVDVPSFVSGVVTKIYPEEGEALCPGEPLFDLRLTREELTTCQLDLTALLRKRDLLDAEARRLETLDPGVAPKSQREIALQRAETDAAIETQKETLRFLGLSDETIDKTIIDDRKLIETLTVRVPSDDGRQVSLETTARHGEVDGENLVEHFKEVEHYCQLEKLLVEKGESVSAGRTLCVISDLRSLWVEAKAYESDAPRLNEIVRDDRPVSLVFADAFDAEKRETLDGLRLRSISNRFDGESRTLSCFVELNNYLSTPSSSSDAPEIDAASGARPPRLNWRFKPGERCELRVPVGEIPDCFVVPVEATAQDLNETFVYEELGREDGKRVWLQRPVVVLARTASEVAIANDGSIEPGARIARRGAYQLRVAKTNGGGKLQSACGHDHSADGGERQD